MERLRELVLALDKSPGEFAVQKEILEIAERLDVRVPDQVVQAGQAALKESYGGFGEKVWEIVEQVFLAEIDCHRLVNAKISLRILSRKFPLSKRVYRLSAMLSEAQGDFQKAIEKYDELLRVNDRDTESWKRKAGALASQGKLIEAIEELKSFLSHFSNDIDAWKQLAKFYMTCYDYPNAKFSLEEVILLEPRDYLAHLNYAEVILTIDAESNAEVARAHYCMAVEINPQCIRAWIGLQFSTSILQKRKLKDMEHNNRLNALAVKRLGELFSSQTPRGKLMLSFIPNSSLA